MPNFFIGSDDMVGNFVSLKGENANHLINVLRHKIGDQVTLNQQNGITYTAKIHEVYETKVLLKVVSTEENITEPIIKVTLFQGLPKKDKMELIIQKCVELGVTEIIPMETERTIVKMGEKEENRISRWNKISEEAAKQSRRGIIPQIKRVMSFKDCLKYGTQLQTCIIPYEKENASSLKDFLRTNGEISSIGIFIGPEGGFSENEISLAGDVFPVTLGKRILRTETAAMVTLAIIMYEKDWSKL